MRKIVIKNRLKLGVWWIEVGVIEKWWRGVRKIIERFVEKCIGK